MPESDQKYIQNRNVVPNHKLKDIARRDEGRFVALMLQNKDLLTEAIESSGISCRHFLTPEHAGVFDLVARYYDKYRAVLTRDAFRSVVEERYGTEDAARYLMAFNEYLGLRVSADDYGKLKDGIGNRFVQQQFYEQVRGGERLAEIIQATTGQSELVSKFVEGMSEIEFGLGDEDEFSRTTSLGDSMEGLMSTLEYRRVTELRERGMLCGLSAIDEEFYGFRRGKYGVFLGFPNGGKTTMMINFAYNMAKMGYKICYVTIESDDEEISERILSKETGIPSKQMKKGGKDADGLSDEVMETIYNANERIKNDVGDNFVYITVPQKTLLQDILARIERKRRFMEFDAVYVDYLDVIGHATHHPNRPDLDIGETSVSLQAWGKKRGIAVWTAQSIKNEKIKEFRKKDFLENPEESLTQIGVEDTGGSQKISRDPDYALAMVPHPDGERIILFVTKARYDGRAGVRMILGWNRSCGQIYDSDGNLESPKDVMQFLEHAREVEWGDSRSVAEEADEEQSAPS